MNKRRQKKKKSKLINPLKLYQNNKMKMDIIMKMKMMMMIFFMTREYNLQ